MGGGRAIAVVGARGGVGASSLAAALAHRLARGGRRGRRPAARGGDDAARSAGRRVSGGGDSIALVDLDGAGGGLDVLLGLEADDGLRWPDLQGARGEVSGDELSALLPRWAGVTVLSADRGRPGAPRDDVLTDVLDALLSRYDRVVLDLDRQGAVAGGVAIERCGVALIVAGRDVRSVAGVLALRAGVLAAVPDVRLVVRGPAPGGLGVLELAHVVDLPVAASMGVQRGLDAVLERGGGPVVPGGGPLGRAVDRLAVALG